MIKPVIMRNKPFSITIIVLIALTGICCVSCGKKAPPQPPARVRLPAVDHLTLDRDGNRVVLSWSLQEVAVGALRDLSGFQVLRARREPPPVGCETCPMEYELVGDVDYATGQTMPETWYFEDNPISGFVYFYKVRTYSVYGTPGPDSRPVEVLIPMIHSNELIFRSDN